MKEFYDFPIQTKVEQYISFPECLLHKKTDKLFIARSDNGNHFLDYGIHEGMMLIFDANQEAEPGKLSCYIEQKTESLRLLSEPKEGFVHAGRLVAAINYYD